MLGLLMSSPVFCLKIHQDFLGGGFKYFLFSPLLGEDSQFDEHIFQKGWFNHQLDQDFSSAKIQEGHRLF